MYRRGIWNTNENFWVKSVGLKAEDTTEMYILVILFWFCEYIIWSRSLVDHAGGKTFFFFGMLRYLNIAIYSCVHKQSSWWWLHQSWSGASHTRRYDGANARIDTRKGWYIERGAVDSLSLCVCTCRKGRRNKWYVSLCGIQLKVFRSRLC